MFLKGQLLSYNEVQEVNLPDIPPVVNISHLDKNLHLMSPKKCSILSNLLDGRYSKHDINAKLTVAVLSGVVHPVDHEVIGEGSFGKVKSAQNSQTGAWEVCKVMLKEDEQKDEAKFLDRMGLLAVSGDIKKNEAYYISKHHNTLKKCLFMRYVPGVILYDMQDHLCGHQMIQLITQLIYVIKDLARNGINHNDIKNDNIVYNYIENKMYAIDFGLSNEINENGSTDLRETIEYLYFFVAKNEWLYNNFRPFIERMKASIPWRLSIGPERTIRLCDQLLKELARLNVLMPESEKRYSMGILDIRDYKNKKYHMADLKQYSQIWLIDRYGTGTLKDYAECRQDLQLEKIWVHNVVYKHPSFSKLGCHLNEICKKRYPDCYFSFTNVSSGKHLHMRYPENSLSR